MSILNYSGFDKYFNSENLEVYVAKFGSKFFNSSLMFRKQIGSLIEKSGGVYKMQYETYHIHLFNLDYNTDLVKHYNDNHQFLWQRMNKKFLTNTKLFEKIEIKWFSLKEMKKCRQEFRNFYRNVVDLILKEEPNIRKFLSKKCSTRRQSRSLRKTQKKTSWF